MKIFARLLIALFLAASPAWAQGDIDPIQPEFPDSERSVFADEADWNSFTSRVETALKDARASNVVLGNLRTQLAEWRDTFLNRQSLNRSRIVTVRAQLDALGPVPEDGIVDPRVSARREALNLQLQTLTAPVILAAEAYTQANGLIGEIDSLIRDRQAALVTQRTQSPLNPTGWGQAWDATKSAVRSARGEVTGNIVNPSRRAELLQVLPGIFALLAVAVVFVLRGRTWFVRLTSLIEARSSRGRAVVHFVLSIGQIIIPFVGLMALTSALSLTGMLGRRLEAVITDLPTVGLFAILAHWLAGQLMPKDVAVDDHPLSMTSTVSNQAHGRFLTLGYMLVLYCLVRDFVIVSTFDPLPYSIVMFPFGVLIAWPLYRLGHVLRRARDEKLDDLTRSFRITVRNMLSRGLMLSATGGVVLAALGYSSAIEGLTFPAAMTVYILAVLVLLQKLSTDAYTLLSKSDKAAQTALMPVLIGFALVLIALPILAVIWGAQVTDLTELWTRFQEGFAIGATRISPSSFLLFALVFVIGYTVTRLIQAALRTTVLPRTKLDAGGQNAIVAGMGYIGIFLAAVIAITTAGIDLSGLAIVAGALSVGIGFGLQNIVSNFVSGIILLIERPISQGDWIEVGGQMGYVRDISVRSTRIETFDRTDVIVPNADLVSNQVTNWTRGNNVGRAIVPVGVAYGTDTNWIASILREIAEAHPMVLLNPPPNVLFTGFGADSLDFEIRAILRDVNYVVHVKSDLNHAIAQRFTQEGIEIPFGQRDIWLRNPEVLGFGDKTVKPAPKKPVKAAQKTPTKDAQDGDE